MNETDTETDRRIEYEPSTRRPFTAVARWSL
jgi:hypothetical protein